MTTILNNASVLLFLLNKIPHGVVVCNINFEIVLWNDFAQTLIGTSPKKINDDDWKSEHKFFNREGKELPDDERALFNAVRLNKKTTSKTIVKFDDHQVYVETTAYPLHDDNNNIIGGVAFFNDVINNIKVNQLLSEIQQKLSEMQEYLKNYIN